MTSWNAESLRAAVVNGPSLHPGARFVEDERGRLVDLAKVSPPVRRLAGRPEPPACLRACSCPSRLPACVPVPARATCLRACAGPSRLPACVPVPAFSRLPVCPLSPARCA